MTIAAVAPWQVWWVDFDPQVGREQADLRPAVVVGTALACELPNQLVIVVPCTTTNRELPYQPSLNSLGKPTFALCDQVKSISRRRLVRRHAARLPALEIESIKFALRRLVDVG